MAGENKIETYLRAEVLKRKGEIYKVIFPSTRGGPDRLAWVPAWTIGCFVELKDEGKDLEEHQKRRHAELKRMGFKTCMVNSKNAVDKLLRKRF